jgi:hypothetical protein
MITFCLCTCFSGGEGGCILHSVWDNIKEIAREIITMMPSLNEILADQLRNRVGVRGGGVTPPALPLSTAGF